MKNRAYHPIKTASRIVGRAIFAQPSKDYRKVARSPCRLTRPNERPIHRSPSDSATFPPKPFPPPPLFTARLLGTPCAATGTIGTLSPPCAFFRRPPPNPFSLILLRFLADLLRFFAAFIA